MRPESFSLVLSTIAPAAELERWLADAPAGHTVIYASGIDLPRGADTVALVRRWADAGLVHLTQARDPADRRRWQWKATRARVRDGVAVPAMVGSALLDPASASCCAEHPATTRQKAALLDLLRKTGGECPSNRAIARDLGLGSDQRARRRADYLLQLLVDAGAIELTGNGPGMPRAVRVLAGKGVRRG